MPRRTHMPRRTPKPSAPMSPGSALVLAAAVSACLTPAALWAAEPKRCSEKVDSHLSELPLGQGEVKSVRIIEKVNIADEFGPEILGVDAWVRLNSCSGWLVMNMTAKCYVRQSYTRGDCRIEGLSNY